MSERSRELMTLLKATPWFAEVGRELNDEVLLLSSWPAAIDACRDYLNGRLYVVPTNQIRYLLREKAKATYPKWNAIADSIRDSISELARNNVKDLHINEDERKLVGDLLSWDIMHACLENEFKEVCSIHFFRKRVELIVAGHFPCGWQGEFPNGKHLVF